MDSARREWTVTLAVEGPADEVEATLSLLEEVMDVIYVERNEWSIPAPTVRVTVRRCAPLEPGPNRGLGNRNC